MQGDHYNLYEFLIFIAILLFILLYRHKSIKKLNAGVNKRVEE